MPLPGGRVSIIERAVSKHGKTHAEPELPKNASGRSSPLAHADPSKAPEFAPAYVAAQQTEEAAAVATASQADAHDLQMPVQGRLSPAAVEIDSARLNELGILTTDGARTALAEEFRHIKRPLLENAFRKTNPIRHGNLIMVTSALPGEGKTFCAINLAMSIAMEMDHTVLLVDADVARPSIPRYLGIDAEKGLMDLLLAEKASLADVMLNTNIERLRILPSGHGHKRATELLASQVMSNLLDEIATRYPDRIVIFDSPPVLLTSEARTLASQMGQIVLVVAAESTTQHGVKDTIRRIGSNENISLVYNKAKDFPGTGYYGKYY